MKAILFPGNSLKFPLVKVIVNKIAYKSLITTKNSHVLRTDHRNVVHENFFRDVGDMVCIKNLFKPIRVINRTNSWAIWTRTSEDIDHFKKWPAPPPLKKIPISLIENFLKPSEVEKCLKSCFSEPTETCEISEFWSVFQAFFNFKWL